MKFRAPAIILPACQDSQTLLENNSRIFATKRVHARDMRNNRMGVLMSFNKHLTRVIVAGAVLFIGASAQAKGPQGVGAGASSSNFSLLQLSRHRFQYVCRGFATRGGKMTPFPTVTIDEKKIILLSGFRTEAGKRVVVTAKQKLEEATRRHRDAVAFGYVLGRWMPAA